LLGQAKRTAASEASRRPKAVATSDAKSHAMQKDPEEIIKIFPKTVKKFIIWSKNYIEKIFP